MSGFFSGEGCFLIRVYKSKVYKMGYNIGLNIAIDQHSRDELLMNYLTSFLGCGYTYKDLNINVITFSIHKFKDIENKIIPLFNEYKVIGVKALDYQDFCKVVSMKKKKNI